MTISSLNNSISIHFRHAMIKNKSMKNLNLRFHMLEIVYLKEGLIYKKLTWATVVKIMSKSSWKFWKL